MAVQNGGGVVMSDTFKELNRYALPGATVSDKQFGRGAFATVYELKYNGLKCAGKVIDPKLYDPNISGEVVHRFADECDLLSQMRHPNIVQFLGLAVNTKKRPVPILVMEYLPINLSSCIDRYRDALPNEIKYSILYDVSLGLKYLHNRKTPIIHRDLTANNVLLATNMTAKISDLGVAKIINLSYHKLSHMTPIPGTLAYMPPEVAVAKPKYNTSIDLFSYGIMMIHVFCGEWPHPKCVAVEANTDGKLTAFSEADRRRDYLCSIGSDHPLMELISKCISNNPATRGSASDIAKQLKKMVVKYPPSFTNRVDMLIQIKALEEEKGELLAGGKQKDEDIKRGLDRIKQMEIALVNSEEKRKKIVERQVKQHKEEIERLEHAHLIEIKQLKLEVKDLKLQVETSAVEKQQRSVDEESFRETIQFHQSTYVHAYDTQKEKFQEEIDKEKAAFTEAAETKKTVHDQIFASYRMIQEVQHGNIEKLCDNLDSAKLEISTLEEKISTLEADKKQIEMLLGTRDSEIHDLSQSLTRRNKELLSKDSALAVKDEIIQSLNDHLTRLKTYLTTRQQHIQQNIIWKQCADLPVPAGLGQTTVINGKVYFGGFITGKVEGGCNVFCYDPSNDKWSALPSLPVWWFGLGQINKQLVAIGGGRVSSDSELSNKVYIFDEKSRKWTPDSFPPMSIARHSPTVLSHPLALVVAGGVTLQGEYVDTLEVLDVKESKWTSLDPLPMPCRDMTSVIIKDACILAGGRGKSALLNGVLCASIEEIVRSAKGVNNACSENPQKSSSSETDTTLQEKTKSPIWSTLPNTPTYQPTISVLASSNIVAIGGGDSPKSVSAQSSVFVLSHITDSWNYIGNLPSPRQGTATAVLSPTEILVIGGWDDSGREKTVFKGTLTTDM